MNQMSCRVACANVMSEPNHYSELQTQLLYNDVVDCLSESAIWAHVQHRWEGHTGYVLRSQIAPENIGVNNAFIVENIKTYLSQKFISIQIPMGAFITNPSKIEGELCNLATTIFDEPTIRKIVYSYLHTPYMWGGMTHQGIDCSGFSQILYRFFNIPLSHIASDQILAGTVLDFLANANIGDLAFFENEQKEINHVGILLSPTEIIHASETNGKVAIDSIDMHGIINRTSGKRTHTLRLIKRLITITK